MKFFLYIIVMSFLFFCSNNKNYNTEVIKMSSLTDSASFLFGYQNVERFKSDTSIKINPEAFINGFLMNLGKDSAVGINVEEAKLAFQKYFEQISENKNKDIIEKARKFMLDNKAKKGVVEVESGLQYIIMKEGSGEKPNLTDSIKVNYIGTFIDGTQFDNSYNSGGPITFRLDQVIDGWKEGLAMMNIGSKYKFFIPYKLAYGPSGNQAIPPFSNLIFEVELLEIKK